MQTIITKQLPYCTESNESFSHEYFVEYRGKTAKIKCISEDESELFNGIEVSELMEMIEAAKTYSITYVELHTNFGVNIHSNTLKNNLKFNNFKIIRK